VELGRERAEKKHPSWAEAESFQDIASRKFFAAYEALSV
jgi:hypothetical protein